MKLKKENKLQNIRHCKSSLPVQNGVQEKKPTVEKPALRAKVSFEKVYSQMDWLKLACTDPDLAGTMQFFKTCKLNLYMILPTI